MRNLSNIEIKELEKDNCGDLRLIKVPSSLTVLPKISGCTFIGNNIISSTLINSTIKDSTILGSTVFSSTICSSKIGAGSLIKSSEVHNSVTIPLAHGRSAYVVCISHSQINDDILLGGTDLIKTKSRGGSIYSYCHVGGGEFTKSILIGTPPINTKSLVSIPHFGYYGKLIALGMAPSPLPKIDSEDFFNFYEKTLLNALFQHPIDIKYDVGRANLGAGTCVSDYDPVTDKKSGVIILLASTGINVSLSPYTTIMPGSLIASSSTDITKNAKDGIIPPKSLLIGSRSSGALLKSYYEKPPVLNDRAESEILFVIRYLKFLEIFSNVARFGASKNSNFISMLKSVQSTAKSVHKRWFLHFFDILDNSLVNLEERIKNDSRDKLKMQLSAQKALLEKKSDFIDKASTIMNKINNPISLHTTDTVRQYSIVLTNEQRQIPFHLNLPSHARF